VHEQRGVVKAGGGKIEGAERAHPLGGCFFFCLNHSIIVLRYKLACSVSYGGKTYKAKNQYPPRTKDQNPKPHDPLVWAQPHASYINQKKYIGRK